MSRPTFADLQGGINLLLLIDGGVLRARVNAAKHVAASASEVSTYERPMRDWSVVSETRGSFGTIAGIVLREYAPPQSPAGNAASTDVANTRGRRSRLAVMAAVDSGESVARQLRAAFSIVKDVLHPNLLDLVGCNSVAGFSILFEAPMLGTLWKALADNAIPPNERVRVALGVALGLEYLHAIGYVHGMLSSQSVHLQPNLRAQIMPGRLEPEWSAAEANPAVANLVVGQPCLRWLPAETILTGAATSATDVYSYSVLLWEIFSSNSSSSTSGGGGGGGGGGGTGHAIPYMNQFPGTLGAEGPGVAGGDSLYAFAKAHNEMPPMAFPAVPDEEGGELLHAIYEACHAVHPPDRPWLSGVASSLLEGAVQSGKSRWEQNRTQLNSIQKLGEGQFGNVYKMETRLFSADGESDFVAVKQLKVSSHTLPSAPSAAPAVQLEADFFAEIDLMKQLRHPNLVTLLGVCTDVRPYLMIMEFLKGGSLEEWLPDNGPKVSQERLTFMLHQVALGFVALGQASLVHRDLASRNVLVDEYMHVKVADYGLSREVEENCDYYTIQTHRALPLRWTAPEVVKTLRYTATSDVYSYGVLIFEVFSFAERPYNAIYDDAQFIRFLSDETAPPPHTELLFAPFNVPSPPAPVMQLMADCTSRTPARRPTFEEIVKITQRSRIISTKGASEMPVSRVPKRPKFKQKVKPVWDLRGAPDGEWRTLLVGKCSGTFVIHSCSTADAGSDIVCSLSTVTPGGSSILEKQIHRLDDARVKIGGSAHAHASIEALIRFYQDPLYFAHNVVIDLPTKLVAPPAALRVGGHNTGFANGQQGVDGRYIVPWFRDGEQPGLPVVEPGGALPQLEQLASEGGEQTVYQPPDVPYAAGSSTGAHYTFGLAPYNPLRHIEMASVSDSELDDAVAKVNKYCKGDLLKDFRTAMDYAKQHAHLGKTMRWTIGGQTETSSLTQTDIAVIYMYTMDTDFYERLNQELGGYLQGTGHHVVEDFLPITKLLVNALNKLPPSSQKLYRGVNLPYKVVLGRSNKVGETVMWKSFISCSTSPEVLRDFLGGSGESAGEQRTVFQIMTISGVRVKDYSAIAEEDEVVLQPGVSVRHRRYRFVREKYN